MPQARKTHAISGLGISGFIMGGPSRRLITGRSQEFFRQRIKHMGIEQAVTAYRAPWQNPYVERLIGSIRRECLNHVIVLNEAHLRRILASYFEYYHESRAHLSLDRNSPIPREVELPERGKVYSIPMVGGLHHWYRRAA